MLKAWWHGSVGICVQAWGSEFDPQVLHCGRRDLTPIGCPLSSTSMPMCTQGTHTHMWKSFSNLYLKSYTQCVYSWPCPFSYFQYICSFLWFGPHLHFWIFKSTIRVRLTKVTQTLFLGKVEKITTFYWLLVIVNVWVFLPHLRCLDRELKSDPGAWNSIPHLVSAPLCLHQEWSFSQDGTSLSTTLTHFLPQSL